MREKITADFLYTTLRDIVGLGHRISGSPAEKAAADYIRQAMIEAGLEEVVYEPFQIRCYSAEKISLRAFAGGKAYSLPAHPIWYSRGATVKAEAVNLGLGSPKAFRDADLNAKVAVVQSKILLNYYPTHSLLQTYHQAAAAGAQAFVAWIDAPYELLPRYNHLKEDEPAGAIPGLLLSHADGLFLNQLLKAAAGGVQLEVGLDSKEWTAATGDVVGYLPGSEDVVIVGSHYDSVYGGAADNAAANAGLIALVHFAKSLAAPRPTLVFCAHPGHEVNVGAREFVARHGDLLRRAYTYLSIDGFASSGYAWSPAGVVPTHADEKRGISVSDNPFLLKTAIAAVKAQHLLPAAYVPASEIIFNKDLEGRFYDAQVPIVMVIGKPIWYHTVADTTDKIMPDQLYRSYLAHAEILKTVVEAGAEQIKASDRRPYEDVISSVLPGKIKSAGWQQGRSVSFGFLPEPAPVGEPTLFCINDFGDPDEVLVDLQWDFGDGRQARGPVTYNVYEKPGRYTVKVTITDSGGYRSVFERVLWVVD
jgi:Zn-dependent M28 family amino/carboxypeptidase